MELGELSVWQWVCAGVAALLVGLSKAGFGGGGAMLAVPLMATALRPAATLAVMLLVLIGGDVFSLVHYVDRHDRRNLLMLLPGLVVGICLGYAVLEWFLGLPDSELWMRRMIGVLCVGFVSLQFYGMHRKARLGAEQAAYRPRAWHGVSVGILAGVTSTLAHAGGPLIDFFLLPQKLEKRIFVGTVIRYFFVGNLIKLIPYWARGMMTWQAVRLALLLMPCVVLGTFAGLLLNRRFSDRAFRLVVYCLALVVGLYLLAGARAPAGGRTSREAQDSQAAFHAGLVALESGDYAAAVDSFRASAEGATPWRDRAMFNAGLACYWAGRYEEAAAAFAQARASQDPEAALQAVFNLGNCAYRLGSFGQAADRYLETVTACRRRLSGPAPPLLDSRGVDLRELLRRAEHNLALSLACDLAGGQAGGGRASPGAGRPSSQAGRSAAGVAGAAVGQRPEPSNAAVDHAAGSGPGVRDVADGLAEAVSRDTGPVLRKGRPPGSYAGKGW